MRNPKKLPVLSDQGAKALEVVQNLPRVDIDNLLLHVTELARTKGADDTGIILKTGDIVRVISGTFVGQLASVVRSGPRHCYVMVEGRSTQQYLFKGQVEKVDMNQPKKIPGNDLPVWQDERPMGSLLGVYLGGK